MSGSIGSYFETDKLARKRFFPNKVLANSDMDSIFQDTSKIQGTTAWAFKLEKSENGDISAVRKIVSFLEDDAGLTFELSQDDINDGYVLGYPIISDDKKSVDIIDDSVITINGKMVFGRIRLMEVETGKPALEPQDLGENWFMDKSIWTYMYKDGSFSGAPDERCGVRLVNSLFTRFGSTYKLIYSRSEHTSNFLKYGKVWEWNSAYFKKFPSTQTKGPSQMERTNRYKAWIKFGNNPSQVYKEYGQCNLLETIGRIALLESENTLKMSSLLPLSETEVKLLNSYIDENGQFQLGLGFSELSSIFKRIIGYDSFDEKISELGRYIKKPSSSTEHLNDFVFRKDQSIKQWLASWQNILIDYKNNRMPADPQLQNQLDKVILASGVCDTPFSSDPERFLQYGAYKDGVLMRSLVDLLVSMLGGFVYSQMAKGSIFCKDGIVRFTIPTQTDRINSLYRQGIHTFISKYPSRGERDKIKLFTLELLTHRAQISVPILTSVAQTTAEITDLNTASLPTGLLSPLSSISGFSGLRSLLEEGSDHTSLGGIDTQKAITQLCLNLIKLFKEQLEESSLSFEEKKIATEVASNQILHLFQGQGADIRRNRQDINKLLDYIASRGNLQTGVNLASVTLSSFGEDFLILPANPDKFNELFGDGFDIYASLLLNTRISNTKTNRDKIQSQRNAIIELGAFLKDLASDKGKIIIYPFKQSKYGLRNQIGTGQFLPEQQSEILDTEEGSSRYFIVDSTDFSSFDNDFYILLGGLLLDGQTFIIKTEDMEQSSIIAAFNLVSGIVLEENLIVMNDLDTITHSIFEAPTLPITSVTITLAQKIQLLNAIARFYHNNLDFIRSNSPTARQDWITTCESVNAITFSQIDN